MWLKGPFSLLPSLYFYFDCAPIFHLISNNHNWVEVFCEYRSIW
jgi:hypothetical protein